MTTDTFPFPPTTDTITTWVDSYLLAWRSNEKADIEDLFTEDAEYHEAPFDTEWIGRDAIVEGWRGRWDWQQGGWDSDWSIASIDGPTVLITGIGHYVELGDFDNVWTLHFDASGLCSKFNMLNTERN
ncbi:nuclear transport factor 2 family protein [Frondihabitans sp. 4ASC-45]|uniref:nuclear transport factor 2 family protein n=1 Tax=Frondihabitans sp. 4ASC-45 TaxID=3111636 RepID=UPI003C192740